MKIDPKENKDMFASISKGYDLTNSIISFGQLNKWYDLITSNLNPKIKSGILDCATGTGNLAIKFAEKSDLFEVHGVDAVPEMLIIAKERMLTKHLNIRFQVMDILNLEFVDSNFDISTIAFGIRNVVSVERCLQEMARVVKPGGKVIILETGAPKGKFKPFLFNIYQKLFVEPVGTILTGNRKAYKYFASSSNEFPRGEDFIKIMHNCGCFSSLEFKPLMLGSIYLYIGIVK